MPDLQPSRPTTATSAAVVPPVKPTSGQSTTEKVRPTSPEKVPHSTKVDQKATSAKIDTAQANATRLGIKKQWMGALYKTLLFASALVVFGLAIASGCVPAIAVSGLLACAMIGDACCALYNYRQERRNQAPLPMANDAIANAIYGVCQLAGVKEKNRIRAGSAVSVLTRIPLMIAGAVIGYAMPSNLSSQASEVLEKLVNPIISAASKAVDVGTEMFATLKSQVEAELAELKSPEPLITTRL